MAAVLLVVGALLLVGGVAFIYWPAALMAAGVLCLLGGIDLTRVGRE